MWHRRWRPDDALACDIEAVEYGLALVAAEPVDTGALRPVLTPPPCQAPPPIEALVASFQPPPDKEGVRQVFG